FHRIVGRESVDLIKSGGYRLGAGEVETSLLARPEVAEVAVVGESDPDLGQRVVAWVVPDGPGGDAVAERLVAHVAEELSWHKRPREVRFVESLPRNAMGKVQKKQLGSRRLLTAKVLPLLLFRGRTTGAREASMQTNGTTPS